MNYIQIQELILNILSCSSKKQKIYFGFNLTKLLFQVVHLNLIVSHSLLCFQLVKLDKKFFFFHLLLLLITQHSIFIQICLIISVKF